MGDWGEFIKKDEFVNFFLKIILKEALKSCKKIISANVKTDVKQQEIKELVAISCNFLYLQDFNSNVKRASIFQFNFAWYSSNLTLLRKSRSGGGGYLTGKIR